EPPVESCPVCAGKVRRKISGGAGFLFKGSGFYITDYRSSEYKKAAEKEKGEKPASKGVSSTTSTTEKSKSSSKGASDSLKS
ncbi:MAG: zinc ribbon domain-containing protein, partial [Candidatus Zixiibacteriota bacterium]